MNGIGFLTPDESEVVDNFLVKGTCQVICILEHLEEENN